MLQPDWLRHHWWIWLILYDDLLEDRHLDDFAINSFLLLFIKQMYTILLWLCTVVNHRGRQNVVKTSVTLSAVPCVPPFLFLPHFDVICDLSLNRHTATWNLSFLTLYTLASMCILPILISLHFIKVLKRRICLSIKRIFSLWSFPLFSWPYCVMQGLHCWEKQDSSHSQGLKG